MAFAKPTTYGQLHTGDRYRLANLPRGRTFRKGSGVDLNDEASVLRATEFDYVAAWEDAASVLWDGLSDDKRTVILDVLDALKDVGQRTDLSVPFGEDIGRSLGALSSEDLASMAAIAYRYSHWMPSGAGREGIVGWKFSNVVDQVLSKRLGCMSRFEKSQRFGYRLIVIEGQLRLTYADSDTWRSWDLGLATPKNYRVASEAMEHGTNDADTLRGLMGPVLGSLLDTVGFMVPKGYQRRDCGECGACTDFGHHESGCSIGQKALQLSRAKGLLKLEDTTISVDISQEDTAPGSDFDDASVAAAVRKAWEDGNDWAWCVVRVRVTAGGVAGEDYLGQCSYEDEDDFRSTSGYFEGMKERAAMRVIEKLESGAALLKKV